MNLIAIAVGTALILGAVALFIVNVFRTPHNLRGFYGVMFAGLMIIGLVGGISLITTGVIGISK